MASLDTPPSFKSCKHCQYQGNDHCHPLILFNFYRTRATSSSINRLLATRCLLYPLCPRFQHANVNQIYANTDNAADENHGKRVLAKKNVSNEIAIDIDT
jgi:hypothetical protein